MKNGKRGFTLIELLVVASILGLLAAVAIPKYGDLIEKANLGATLGNLSSLRAAVSIYYGTYLGYAHSIDPEVEPEFSQVLHGNVPFVKARYPHNNSPYGNTVTVKAVAGLEPSDSGKGWFYNSSDGCVYINSIEKDVKGTVYASH